MPFPFYYHFLFVCLFACLFVLVSLFIKRIAIVQFVDSSECLNAIVNYVVELEFNAVVYCICKFKWHSNCLWNSASHGLLRLKILFHVHLFHISSSTQY